MPVTRWSFLKKVGKASDWLQAALRRTARVRGALPPTVPVLVSFGRSVPAFAMSLVRWWWHLGAIKRNSMAAGVVLIALLGTLGGFTWSGVSAALDAREAYQHLQAELSQLTPVDLIQVNVFQTLEESFQDAEESSARARSRLGFLKAFQWVPVLGKRIRETHALLDIGYYQGRAGRNLSNAHSAVLDGPLENLTAEAAVAAIEDGLQRATAQLELVEEDLKLVSALRANLGATQRGVRYGRLLDQYLPSVRTIAYLSRNHPNVIGHTYALSRELITLQELARDPLDVISNPSEVGRALTVVTEQAVSMENALLLVRRIAQDGSKDGDATLQSVDGVLENLLPGVVLLRRVTAGARGLVAMAEAIESGGFLSAEFGEMVGDPLKEARQELTLAKEEVASLPAVLSATGIDPGSFLPQIGFGASADPAIGTPDRVELLIDQAAQATDFLISFLGYDGPRKYLLLGQNQNEIRPTGGFIGIAVEATLDGGELTSLIFHDSRDVDPEPLTLNPVAPEGLYWYLWMDRMLFRDSNWNPHFPSAAAKVAEIYQLGLDVQLDGVITATKLVSWDLVELLGDVKLPGLEGVVTRQIVEQYSTDAYQELGLSYDCRPEHVSLGGKRCFDEDVFFVLKDRLAGSIPPDMVPKVVDLFKDHLNRKNILMHVFQPIDDSFLWDRGWNGAVAAVDHDYLMVVDSSLPGHSNAKVERSWEYRVSPVPNKPINAQLRLRYYNGETPKDEICRQFAFEVYRCYWNYVRVYVPPAASKIDMPAVPLHEGSLRLVWGYPDPDSGSVVRNAGVGPARPTELGAYIAVDPGTSMTIPISYELPSEILRETAPGTYQYRLLVQKQPGIDDDRVSIEFELPPGAALLDTSPEFNSRKRSWVIFDFVLQEDTTVVVSFATGEG